MALFPVRDLAQYGLVLDTSPFDAPLTAWTLGTKNVRFDGGRVSRAPVFRSVRPLEIQEPRSMVNIKPYEGLDKIIVGYADGRLTQLSNGVLSDVHPGSFSGFTSESPHSFCYLSDILYFNREDHIPWYLPRNGASFEPLPDFPSDVRFKLLRAFGSALVGFGVTLNGVYYPSMAYWSDLVPFGAVPGSWDIGDPTTSAGNNVMAEMEDPIVEAQPLKNAMVVYSQKESWLMEQTGDNSVFAFRRLFSNAGAMSANCVVEVDGIHYVFGYDDIYKHDGISKVSISEGRVKEFVYSSMNFSEAHRCFVHHNKVLKELMFCYVSEDSVIEYREGATGCNRGLVYNYKNDNWSMVDLPFVVAAGHSTLNNAVTYETNPEITFDSMGGSYLDQQDSLKTVNLFVGNGGLGAPGVYGLTSQIYTLDGYENNTLTGFPIDPNATKKALARREYMDLDELAAELKGYKNVVEIYPEGRLSSDSQPLVFTFGASDYANEPPEYGPSMTYNGLDEYKLDFKSGGRFLSMRIEQDDYKNFELSGFDIEIVGTGRR